MRDFQILRSSCVQMKIIGDISEMEMKHNIHSFAPLLRAYEQSKDNNMGTTIGKRPKIPSEKSPKESSEEHVKIRYRSRQPKTLLLLLELPNASLETSEPDTWATVKMISTTP